MYLLTNKDSRAIALPAPCGAVVLEIGGSAEVTDDHYLELLESIHTASAIKRGAVVVEYCADPPAPVKETQKAVRLVSQGGGWWRVYVNDHNVTDNAVRKSEAEQIAADYE